MPAGNAEKGSGNVIAPKNTNVMEDLHHQVSVVPAVAASSKASLMFISS